MSKGAIYENTNGPTDKKLATLPKKTGCATLKKIDGETYKKTGAL